jgi:hypothetical protein
MHQDRMQASNTTCMHAGNYLYSNLIILSMGNKAL